jgi:hypothetical protein
MLNNGRRPYVAQQSIQPYFSTVDSGEAKQKAAKTSTTKTTRMWFSAS